MRFWGERMRLTQRKTPANPKGCNLISHIFKTYLNRRRRRTQKNSFNLGMAERGERRKEDKKKKPFFRVAEKTVFILPIVRNVQRKRKRARGIYAFDGFTPRKEQHKPLGFVPRRLGDGL